MGKRRFQLADVEPVYGDLNGDGKDDAVVTLHATDGDHETSYAYVWLWDAKAKSARQVATPVTDTATCGNAIESMTITKGRLQLVRLVRDEAGKKCDTEPTRRVKNTVELKKGFPVTTAPVLAAAGPCHRSVTPPAPPREVFEGKVFLAPDLRAPSRNDLDALGKVGIGGDDKGEITTTNGWVQVVFHTPKDRRTDYCAWFPGE